jgi:hypothetical protein
MRFIIGFAVLAAVIVVILHFLQIIQWSILQPMYWAILAIAVFCGFVFWWSTRFHKE